MQIIWDAKCTDTTVHKAVPHTHVRVLSGLPGFNQADQKEPMFSTSTCIYMYTLHDTLNPSVVV